VAQTSQKIGAIKKNEEEKTATTKFFALIFTLTVFIKIKIS